MKRFHLLVLLCIYLPSAIPASNDVATDGLGSWVNHVVSQQIGGSMQSDSAQKMLTTLGVSVHTLGTPSLNQTASMGVAGAIQHTFALSIKPACHNQQIVSVMQGQTLLVVCQSPKQGYIQLQWCQAGHVLSYCQAHGVLMTLSVHDKPENSGGYQWSLHCDSKGYCHGKVSQQGKITGNAQNLSSIGRAARGNNAAYQTIAKTYVKKSGYSRVQAYTDSLSDGGSNQDIAGCITQVGDTQSSGQYASCNGSQNGQLFAHCETKTICTQYHTQTQEETTAHICTLTPAEQTLTCQRQPAVTIDPVTVIEPHCQHLVIVQKAHHHCPRDYATVISRDMYKGPLWDDVRLCTQEIPSAEKNPYCFAGAYYINVGMRAKDSDRGRGVLPRGASGYIAVSHAYQHDHLVRVTVIDETTGKVIANRQLIRAGKKITLPLSRDEDQTFRFYISSRGQFYTGVLVMLVSHQQSYKTATVRWQQTCPEGGE